MLKSLKKEEVFATFCMYLDNETKDENVKVPLCDYNNINRDTRTDFDV